jgi:hypothetical protein
MRKGVGTRQQLFEEKFLLARFAKAAGSGDDLKADRAVTGISA